MPEIARFNDVIGFNLEGAYLIRIEFDDETEQLIDFEPILHGPLFGPLRDLALFNRVRLDRDIGTLVWSNGADIDPNVLHDWQTHVDAIIKRRQVQFADAA